MFAVEKVRGLAKTAYSRTKIFADVKVSNFFDIPFFLRIIESSALSQGNSTFFSHFTHKSSLKRLNIDKLAYFSKNRMY